MSRFAGSMSLDEIRNKFGLTYSAEDEAAGFKTGSEGEDKNNDNQVWYEGSDGQMKLLGTRKGGLSGLLGNNELKKIRKSDTSRFDVDNEFNSESDVAGTLRYLMEAQDEKPAAKKQIEEEPEMEMSPEYAEAKARISQYQEDVASGRTAEELFGTAPDSSSFLDRYRMKLGERLENGNYRPPKVETTEKAAPPAEDFVKDKEKNTIQ